jgi:uncharacterized protein YndB with AHSA1/START domain
MRIEGGTTVAIIQRQTTVNATPDEVYAYVSDISKHPEWAAHKLKVEPKPPGSIQVGAAFETVGQQFGEQPGTVTITELVPGEKVVYESDGPVGHFRHQFMIQKAGEGSVRLIKAMEPLKVSSLPLKLLSPLVGTVIAPRGLDGDLKRIKEKLEHKA